MVMVGSKGPVEGINAIFINGAILIDGEEVFKEDYLIDDMKWENIYRDIKNHFDGNDIVGWVYIPEDSFFENDLNYKDEKIVGIHKTNFPGNDKLLLIYDAQLREENFYRLVSGELKKEKGHYIYYERNDNMQEYMVKSEAEKNEEECYEDEIVKKFRKAYDKMPDEKYGVIKNKTEEKNIYGKRMYACAMAALLLVLGIAAYKNSDLNIRSVQDVFDVIKGNESEKNKGNTIYTTKPIETVKPSETVNTKEPEITTTKPSKTKQPATVKPTTKEPESNKEYKYYEVKEGDTLAAICIAEYGDMSKVKDVCEANNISDENKIFPGDKIIIP
jgi:LysM repeat protein